MRLLRRLVTRYWPFHPCIIHTCDMAMGVPGRTVPVTAFRYRCVLCSREFTVLTESGLEQLEDGNPRDEVLDWVSPAGGEG